LTQSLYVHSNPNLAALQGSCWLGLSLGQVTSWGCVLDGIAHPSDEDPITVPHTVPGQQVTAEVPAQTPSSGSSKQVSLRATHLPPVQSSPAQQSVVAVQAFPSAVQDTARQVEVLPPSADTHSVP
jgi:hypothetical protein